MKRPAVQKMMNHRVPPGKRIDLSRADASDTSGFDGGKAEAAEELARMCENLEKLQDLLYASHQHKVLIVLQGMDTSGKDGTIRHVFSGTDPLGIRVASFGVPTAEELDHDFLWRVHRQVPGKGEIVIFNRSHYEDVLIVRVRKLAPEKVWKARYDQINEFEKILADTGTRILKFFLYIDKEEQRERLEKRLKDPAKQWKFRRGDLDDRKLWDEYITAYEDVLEKTSTEQAPWYIVPANRKWYRNLVVSRVLIDALERLKMRYPRPAEDLSGITVE
jgi:PPK2 family polyphosphate:nucleotide phosphotransferase